MKLILNEEETKDYLSLFRRTKYIYKTHNRLVALLKKIQIIQNELTGKEVSELMDLMLPFDYPDLED